MITVAILYIAGVPWQHFAAIAAVAAVIGGGARCRIDARDRRLRGYQEDRLTSFLNPAMTQATRATRPSRR